MKIHEIIPKMLGKAMKLFHRFLIEFSQPVAISWIIHGLLWWKTHSFMANECIPGYFMATDHP